MTRTAAGMLVAAVAVLTITGAAVAQYDPYPPPPPPSPTPPPSTPAPAGMSVVRAQAKIAATHAGFAAGGSTVAYVKEHLRHTIACIEGSKGRNVRPNWMNPCSGNGNGVLVDLRRIKASASLIRTAQSADATAVAAIKGSNLTQLKSSARRVQQLINQIATAR